MKKGVLFVIIGILIILIASIFIWGFFTNWWKSFDAEKASRYCYTACLNLDREKYCTPNLIIHFEDSSQFGSKWKDVNCNSLAINNIVGPCEDIKCP